MRRLSGALLAAALAGAAAAHGPASDEARPTLEPLPPALAGVVVQLAYTLAPQILVENRSGRRLEVLDADGVPFLRLDADGAHADLGARAWYASFTAGGLPPAPDAARAGWRTLRREPAWGWFDPRLRRGAAASDRWHIGLRLDGQALSIGGRFVAADPAPAPLVSLRVPPALSHAIEARVVSGAPPAIFLRNRSAAPLVVLGLQGEPYLRLSASGVELNLHSATARERGHPHAGEPAPTRSADAPWQRIADTSAYTWIEPRAALAGAPRRAWRVALEYGGERHELQGYSEQAAGAVAHARAGAAQDGLSLPAGAAFPGRRDPPAAHGAGGTPRTGTPRSPPTR